MTATGECTIEPRKWAKKTPVPSDAIIEYAMCRSSPTAATDGGGRSQPRVLTSTVSTATGAPQLRPESGDAAIYRTALLSARSPHHTARRCVAPRADRTEVGHIPGAVIDTAVVALETNRAFPAE